MDAVCSVETLCFKSFSLGKFICCATSIENHRITLLSSLFLCFGLRYTFGISDFLRASHWYLIACRIWGYISLQVLTSAMEHCQQSLPMHSMNLLRWAVESTVINSQYSTLFLSWVLGVQRHPSIIYLPVSYLPGSFSQSSFLFFWLSYILCT